MHLPEDRITTIRSLLATKACTHILITDNLDVRYISGFRASQAHLLISRRQLFLIVDFRYKQSAQEFCTKHRAWHYHAMPQDGFSYLSGLTGPEPIIGVQSNVLTLDQFKKLRRSAGPGARFKHIGIDIADTTIAKEPHEIKAIAAAAHIADRALAATIKKLRPGISEIETALLLEDAMRRGGSPRTSFETIVLFGANTALVHGRPGSSKLKSGHLILFDFGCTIDDYCSDMTRTYVFGKATSRQKKIHRIVLAAQEKARAAAKAAIPASFVDAAAREIIDAAGYRDCFGHATGHGIGLRVHEAPRLGKSSTTLLPCNSIFSIEPGIYVPGFGGVRIEDLCVARPDGIRILTHAPRELVEIGL